MDSALDRLLDTPSMAFAPQEMDRYLNLRNQLVTVRPFHFNLSFEYQLVGRAIVSVGAFSRLTSFYARLSGLSSTVLKHGHHKNVELVGKLTRM